MSVRVLFVCLGNICRSPTAHGVFRQRVQQRQAQDLVTIDSAGTGSWHVGEPPDRRAVAAAASRGVDISDLRARQVAVQDFARFDYILAMDEDNLANLRRLCPASFAGELALFLNYAPGCDHSEVPDPYYGGEDGFGQVLDLVESASAGLLDHIIARHRL